MRGGIRRGALSLWLSLAAALFGIPLGAAACASGGGVSAEESYALGQAYFDLGRYDAAEQWFNRAKRADKTKTASEYNLGRIAFEQGRYGEAARIFDGILAQDPGNVLALKAAAYTRIKMGALEEAEGFYNRVLSLAPESADDGYNYALVLSALEKPAAAAEVLLRYPFALEQNGEALLLLARLQDRQNKVEAIDSYSRWLSSNTDPQVSYEYAQSLEKAEFYARALEEYRKLLNADLQGKIKRGDLRFSLARLLLIADSGSEEGLTELAAAVSEGFADVKKMEALMAGSRMGASRRDRIRALMANMPAAAE